MSDKPWYHKGLRFKCTQCGDCCTGEPGYVWVNKREIEALAAEIGESDIDEFERKHVRKIGIRKSLVELANGDCIFFDNETRKCGVYGERPRQCRTWPFWRSNLKNAQDWATTCETCPGSGKGQLYSLESIDRQRDVIRI